jgi:hypothetical protein
MLAEVNTMGSASLPAPPPHPPIPSCTDEESEPDLISHSLDSRIIRAPTGLKAPSWCKSNVRNCRGAVPPSTAHYMAIV